MEIDEASTDQPKNAATGLCTERPELDFVNYDARTFKSDLRLWVVLKVGCRAGYTLMTGQVRSDT
jgi:hypothetical protein